MKTKKVFLCKECNSPDIEELAWRGVNSGEFTTGYESDDNSDHWCNTCQSHSDFYEAELNEDAKVIGYQVVGVEGTENEGHIHPDMEGSFCLYNLTKAQEMAAKGSNWKPLTIWSGDIEEPTFMFEGDDPDF